MRCYGTRHTVAALRKIIGLSQSELAALVGCSKRTVQAIEIGQLRLSEGLAAKIAHETGVTESWLLAGDHQAPPKLMLTDAPYDKKNYEETRAAIAARRNPNLLAINLSHEGLGFLKTPPMPMLTKVFEELNSLMHPQMDYWLASILASIFAATKAGQARLAICRLADFADAMKKEFGQHLNDEFADDATVVFEQALQRIKVTEFLVKKDASESELPSNSPAKKAGSAYRDLLANWQFSSELEGLDEEVLWAELNGVGERLKARSLRAQRLSETLSDQIMAVFRAPKPGGPKSNPSDVLKTSKPGAIVSEKPRKKPAKD